MGKTHACFLFSLVVFTGVSGSLHAGPGDALVNYNLGLAAQRDGDAETAYRLFKSACMASDGVADACIAWAELAEEQGNDKDVKRALGSAVMLAPEDIRGRFALASKLLKKQDSRFRSNDMN